MAVVGLAPVLALGLAAPAAHAQSPTERIDSSVAPPKAAAKSGIAPGAAVKTRRSWNPHLDCRATVTTLRILLGKRRNKLGGATYRGGGFKPGIPNRRAFHPPCHINGHPTMVQLNGVKVGSCKKISGDGDWTCSLWDPSTPATRPKSMKSIHIETDRSFRRHSGWSRPPGGVLIRVQGFVFWDPGHTTAAWHNYTGWELHSFTAWRSRLE
jgi:hypothetical protein